MGKHLTQQELVSLLSAASQKVEIGASYKHYKNQLSYTVLDLAIQESDEDVVVVYRADYEDGIKFTRPLKSWLQNVAWQDKMVPRFTKI